MAGDKKTNSTNITGCNIFSEDNYPKFLKKENFSDNDNIFIGYPTELFIGDQDKFTNPLAIYFENKNWEYSWDFDKKRKVYWYNVYSEDTIVVQIEFNETVKELIEGIKELVPAIKKNEDFNKDTPIVIKKHLETLRIKKCIYIGDWDGN